MSDGWYGTHFIQEWIPLESGVLKDLMSERQHDFAQKIVAAEVVIVPNGEPEAASVYFSDRQSELQNFIKNRIQGVLLDSGLAFP